MNLNWIDRCFFTTKKIEFEHKETVLSFRFGNKVLGYVKTIALMFSDDDNNQKSYLSFNGILYRYSLRLSMSFRVIPYSL
jgi:hypothetical protein